MLIYEFAALGAALCWSFSTLISAGPSAQVGALRFNRTRMALVFIMLALWSLATGKWSSIAPDQLLPLIISGFIGIFLGDTALFLTLNRLGPRRTGILFATNAPMTAILGWVFLDESLNLRQIEGITLIFVGVVLAIVFGKRRSQLHHWENVKGPLSIGILLGLCAALAQAVGAIIARPVMETGTVDPVSASALRVGISALALALFSSMPFALLRQGKPLTFVLTLQIALSGFLGMGIGMTLILYALTGGEAGIVTTLSATSPAILLPLLWIKTGERPALGAWAGAALVIIGSALLFSTG